LRAIRQGNKVEFNSSSNVRETEEAVVVDAIVERESILLYCNGRGYRPAQEIFDALFTMEGAWIVAYRHTEMPHIMNKSDIRGRVRNVTWDSEVHAARGELHFFKALCSPELLRSVRDGTLSKDTSSSYYCNEILTPGEFGGEPYDFYQEDFMFHHVAVGIPEGRCPSPYCGILDSFEDFLKVGVHPAGEFSCRLTTVLLSAGRGIYAQVGKLATRAGTFVKEFLFDLNKGWTLPAAQEWVKSNHNEDLQSSSQTEPKDVRGKTPGLLNPLVVIEQSRRLLGNMSPGRGPKQCYDQRGMVRSPPRRGVINSENNEQVEFI
jgi:Uncharacterized protein conserved in bacteria (DUF2213)